MDRTELAWAAGFFDAEGWAAAFSYGGRTQLHARINQADPSGMPEALERFHSAVGVGRVGGPARAWRRIDLYRWEASSRADLTSVWLVLQPWLRSVKREQFRAALGFEDPELPGAAGDELLAWAAGLFDGDGSTCLAKHRTHGGHYTAEVAITQSSASGRPDVLTRFAEAVGVGRVFGPYPPRGGQELVYRYRAVRFLEVQHVIRSLWPWLGTIKRVQAATVLAVVSSQPTLPRGNPAWGSHKTHCVNGHEYATARMRPFRSRGGGTEKRPSSYCLACLREHARRKRVEIKLRCPLYLLK